VYIDLMRVFISASQCVYGGHACDAGLMSILYMVGEIGCVVSYPVCEVHCRCF
jgi:hypothetical protein